MDIVLFELKDIKITDLLTDPVYVCVFTGQEEDGRKVLVLSYPQYCRYRSVLARLREQPSSLLIDHTVLALGGIAALGGATRIDPLLQRHL